MSDEQLTFHDILGHLAHNPDPYQRVEAAQILGHYVKELNDEEYSEAHKALTQALNDRDPMVIMAVMEAMSRYNRKARQQAREARETGDVRAAIAIPLCQVCNKPEALADGTICPHDNCPYRQ